jgi:hypothetical protein
MWPCFRFFIPNYHFYRIDRYPGRKGGTAVAVRNGIPHDHVELSPLVSVEATGVCIPIGDSEVLLQLFTNIRAGPGVMLTSLSS